MDQSSTAIIDSFDSLLKVLIANCQYNDHPIFYIQNDTTIKNPFDGSQLRTIVITVNYYEDCPLLNLNTPEVFDAFISAQGEFIGKFVKILPNIYSHDHPKYFDLNGTHIFRSYNMEYYLTLQATDLGFFITEYLNIP